MTEMRSNLRLLLSDSGEWEVCGEAKDGREAVKQAHNLHPDLIILDYYMPEMNGFEAAREIRLMAPATKIVMFSIFDTLQMQCAARLIGADAYVSKAASAEGLLATLKQVLKSEDDFGHVDSPDAREEIRACYLGT